MKSLKCLVLLALCILILTPVNVSAQTSFPYAIDWWTFSSGGSGGGGNYTVNAAIGQPVTSTFQGGRFTLSTGFLGMTDHTSGQATMELYLPNIMRGS